MRNRPDDYVYYAFSPLKISNISETILNNFERILNSPYSFVRKFHAYWVVSGRIIVSNTNFRVGDYGNSLNMDKNDEQRIAVIFCFMLGKSVTRNVPNVE